MPDSRQFPNRGGGRPGPPPGPPQPGHTPEFDPSRSEVELLDTLAEKQAEHLDRINSAQLRRFFGEVKDLYRQFEALTAAVTDDGVKKQVYEKRVEPRFKMLRSKVAYAQRAGGQGKVPASFAQFLMEGVKKVSDFDQFRKFVMHFEAVVGFLYGMDKVKS
jgi:CRISPR type III-A-associated protein Csm2